jgi:hypothetical protein
MLQKDKQQNLSSNKFRSKENSRTNIDNKRTLLAKGFLLQLSLVKKHSLVTEESSPKWIDKYVMIDIERHFRFCILE